VFILDTCRSCFVWVGNGASPREKFNGFGYAHVSLLYVWWIYSRGKLVHYARYIGQRWDRSWGSQLIRKVYGQSTALLCGVWVITSAQEGGYVFTSVSLFVCPSGNWKKLWTDFVEILWRAGVWPIDQPPLSTRPWKPYLRTKHEAAILDLVQLEIALFDPPTPQTLS